MVTLTGLAYCTYRLVAMDRAGQPPTRIHPLESSLETVALFFLKLAYEEEGGSPIRRKDAVMDDYQKDVFGLLVRRGDVKAIQLKMDECLELALDALGGANTPLGKELHKLSSEFGRVETMEALDAPLTALGDYLKDAQ
jgi:hypothetical protein